MKTLGGVTVRIPTSEEMQEFLTAMAIYEDNREGEATIDEGLQRIPSKSRREKVRSLLEHILEVAK